MLAVFLSYDNPGSFPEVSSFSLMRRVASQKIRRVIAWLALAITASAAFARAQTFLTVPLNLSGTGKAIIPSMAIGPGGDINIVWLDSGAILFRHSTDGGQTFSAAMVVATTNLPPQPSQPQIVADAAGGIYVAWAGPGDVYFSSLSSGSSTWMTPVNVSLGKGITPGSAAPVPHMAVDPNGGVDLVWGQNSAFFARTSDGGKSFPTVTLLSPSPMAAVSPRLAINTQGTIYVVWENAGSCPAITFGRSIDNGGTFTDYPVDDTLTVSGVQQTGCTYDVQIAIGASNTVHLLWANDHSTVQSIRDLIATYQVDNGGSFAGFDAQHHLGFQNLSSTASYTPQMAIDGSGDINVVWMGEVSNSDSRQLVNFSRSTNGGGSFVNATQLTTAPAPGALATASPQITTESTGAIDIVWQQASASNPSSAYDIVLARSTNGVNFSTTTLDSTATTQSATAQIAADASGNIYATWDGNSGGSGDILLNGDSAGLHAAAQFSISGIKLSASPLSAVINVSGSATFSLSLSSTNSVPGNVTLSCGGAPAGVSCTFNPNPVSLAANSSASTTLAVGVTVKPSGGFVTRDPGAGLQPNGLAQATGWSALVFTLLVGMLAFGVSAGLPRFARSLTLAALLVAAVAGMSSCGGSTQNGGGGGGGGSITFPLTLQGRANSGTAALQTISITVP